MIRSSLGLKSPCSERKLEVIEDRLIDFLYSVEGEETNSEGLGENTTRLIRLSRSYYILGTEFLKADVVQLNQVIVIMLYRACNELLHVMMMLNKYPNKDVERSIIQFSGCECQLLHRRRSISLHFD